MHRALAARKARWKTRQGPLGIVRGPLARAKSRQGPTFASRPDPALTTFDEKGDFGHGVRYKGTFEETLSNPTEATRPKHFHIGQGA